MGAETATEIYLGRGREARGWLRESDGRPHCLRLCSVVLNDDTGQPIALVSGVQGSGSHRRR